MTTDWHKPQPRSPRNACPPARCSAVRWSRVISPTMAAVSIGSPPRSSIRANASRSSAVDTSPAAPSANSGGRLHCPSGGSQTVSPSGVGMYAVGSRSTSEVKNAVSRIPSGSRTRLRSASAYDVPAARAQSTLSTCAPVLYSQRSPGWAISGREPRPAIHVSGSGMASGVGGPIVQRPVAAAATGQGSGDMNIPTSIPKPNVNVSRSRTVMARLAGTVSSSGPSICRSTRGFASSGSKRSTGSSSASSPSRASASVAAPVIGLVVDAILNSESRCTAGPPIDNEPKVSTCTWSPWATNATNPGTLSSPMYDAATALNFANPSAVNPPDTRTRSSPPLDRHMCTTYEQARTHRGQPATDSVEARVRGGDEGARRLVRKNAAGRSTQIQVSLAIPRGLRGLDDADLLHTSTSAWPLTCARTDPKRDTSPRQ